MHRQILLSIACAGLVATACGGQGAAPKSSESIAKALAESDKNKLSGHDADVAMKKLKERAEEEAKAAREALYANAIKLPSPMPATIEDACKQSAAAFDTFRKARIEGPEIERWNMIREGDLATIEKDCLAAHDLQVAACEAHAFSTADRQILDENRDELRLRCKEKFGTAAAVAKAQ